MSKERKKKLKERAKRRALLIKKSEVAPVKLIPLTTIHDDAKEPPCGDCQACCEVVAVHELNKPTFTTCQHQCEKGCGIYEQRPPSCATYQCLYKTGILGIGEELRPDNLGLVLDFRGVDNQDAIGVWETWEGAADEDAPKFLLEQLAKKFIVYVRRYKSMKRIVLGPREKMMNSKFREYI